MYEYLRQHPQIFFPSGEGRAKEPNHFCPELEIADAHSIKDRRAYLDLYRGSSAAAWRGDASIYHLLSESAPGNIKRFCPEARILVMLRPPVEMMHSYHSELVRHHHEDIVDFPAAIAASEDRRSGSGIPSRTGVPRCLDYLSISRFAPQVERYHQAFGRDRVKIVLLEDMVAAPTETFREILRFLEVDSSFQPEFRVHNETPRHGRLEHFARSVYKHSGVKHATQLFLSYERRRKVLSFVRRMEKGIAASAQPDDKLRESCRLDVDNLAALIGRDLSHWQPGPRR